MKTLKFKMKLLACVPLFGMILSCQVEDPSELNQNLEENDSLFSKAINCTKTGSRNVDEDNPINHGELDDRTCSYDYEEKIIGTKTFGSYRIKPGSTNVGTSTLSPRMERKFAPRPKPNNGAYQLFKGTFRIENVGGGRGTYFIQAKGKHVGHTDPDPAIALFIAREVKVGNDTYFDIYREEVTKRDGRFSNNGRRDVYLTRVKKHENFAVELKTGFRVDSSGKITQHYVNAKIKGKNYYYNTPSPNLALETGIRYGAYSITSGTARIYVTDTYFDQKD